jgi:hypothetical protein
MDGADAEQMLDKDAGAESSSSRWRIGEEERER